VLADLAEQVARDGEGARKLVEIIVEGAVSKRSARGSRCRSPTRRW
jgi:glutamate N-acetyltransferase/amino-acid N-acetyltransferase